MSEIRKDVVGSLAWGLGMAALALVSVQARELGWLEPDTVTRLVIGANGLFVAWMGNRLPKSFVPSVAARRARRVAGWSLALSGLVYAALAVLAPIPVACWGGAAAVLAGIAVTLGYCLSLRDQAKAS